MGNGYCYTLAYECFLALHEEDKSVGRAERIMISQGTSFGLCIFTHYVSHSTAPVSLSSTAVQPGDILQFFAARWIKKDADGRVVHDKQAGAPERLGRVLKKVPSSAGEPGMGPRYAFAKSRVGKKNCSTALG